MPTSHTPQHDNRPHLGLIIILVALIGAITLPVYSRSQPARPDSALHPSSPKPASPPVLHAKAGERPASAKSVLIYGPSLDYDALSNEQSLAEAAGYSVTIVDPPIWSSMTTAQFAAFDAIVFGDPSCFEGTDLLAAANASKSLWSAAITGPIYIQGTDAVFHEMNDDPVVEQATKTLITDGLNFAASGPGTGLYVSLSCYYWALTSAEIPIDFLSGIGAFKVSGLESACGDSVTIVKPTHPAMAGLTDASLSNWGCSVHEFVTSFPSNFEVLATAVRVSDGTSLPYIIASIPAAATPTPTPTATPTPTPTPLIYPKWTFTGDLNTARRFHTATLLPNGKVLAAGGFNNTNNSCNAGACLKLNTAELFDPSTGTWTNTGNLSTAREEHTATLLPNGKVLVAGGISNSAILQSAELYDPATGAWTSTGNMNSIRAGHSATLLANGKVLIAGGFSSCCAPLNTAELYDPATGAWTTTGNLNTGRSSPATLLPNGKVLVAGGYGIGDAQLSSAELYDPIAGTWSNTGSLHTAKNGHAATLLPNGKVLVDGRGASELYDPNTGTWTSTGSPISDRASDTATLLQNGKVVVAAGVGGPILSSAELYDPASEKWTITAYLNTSRVQHSATLLADGRVLVTGGYNESHTAGGYINPNDLVTSELYDSSASPNINMIDDAKFFVQQHYFDFLEREPDAAGLAYWTDQITSCGADAQCIEVKRINVSAAFYVSIEFQETGYFVYRVHKAARGNLPGLPVPIKLDEFLRETTYEVGFGVIVGQPGWEQVLDFNKQIFINDPDGDRWTSAYPTSMTPAQFVDTLFANAEVTPSASERAAAINEFGAAMTTVDIAARQRALRRVVDNPTLKQQEFNRAFVLMQYFGYLRRNPDDLPDHNFDGYNFWLNKLDQFHGNFVEAEMVKAFLSSIEYRQRFGPP